MKLARFYASVSASALALIATPAIAGEISGSVVDETETIALQAATIRIVELGRQTVAERDGSFRFPEVPAGTYTLVASYVGAPSEILTLSVPETGTVRADFALGGETAAQILVVGQFATQASALSRKRAADGVSDVLTRDAIGQFPDQNVAESLRRLPGINILNDQGEGRFVSVRGLDPELNSTSLNGVRLPAPESDVRSVALDVVSSDIIESIEVKKSLTPDMDADTIGASIEIETTSAFDRQKNLISAKAEGSYNDYSGKVTPKGSIDVAYRVSDNVGVSGGLSYYKREFETDNIEADDWADEGNGVFAQTVEYRDYDVERERISATLGFDFRVADHTKLYAKGIYSQFDDREYRRRLTFDLGDFDDASSITGNAATFNAADERIQVERDVKDRFETQKIRSLALGGETDVDGWHAEYSASWAKSSERENGSIDPAEFRRRFDPADPGDPQEDVVVAFDYSDWRLPMYSVSGADGALFFDPAEYELNDIELTRLSDSQDEEYAAKFDLGRDFYMDSGTFTVQGGFKGRWREKTYDKTVEFWENDALTLADVLGSPTYRITDIAPVASYTGATEFFLANMADFEFQDEDSFYDSAVEDYTAEEDVLAGYLLGRWESSNFTAIGGVRYEHTSTGLTGNMVFEDDVFNPVTQTFENNYDHWLPSLNLRWEAQDDLILRLAGYRSLVRPKLSKLAPRAEVNEDGEIEVGNPGLQPYEAWNIDASAEFYFGRNAAITAAVFYKDISNFIVDTVTDDGVFNGVTYPELAQPINGDSAEVYGLELGYSQQWSMLPEPFDGLITQLNYTYTDATGTVPVDGDVTDLRQIDLPSTSKHTFNAVLGFEKGPISLRLAGTYRDKYLDELGDEAEVDRFVEDHFQLDLSAKYRITEQVQVFYEWININNAKYVAYNNFGGQQNLYQYEEYSWTMKFGAKVNF